MTRQTPIRKGAAHAAPVFSGPQVKSLVRFDPNQLRYTITEQGRALLQEIAAQEEAGPTRRRSSASRRSGGKR